MSKNLDVLLEELKDSGVVAPAKPEDEEVNDENVNEYILKKCGKLVSGGVDAVDALKDLILTSGEPTEIAAYSDLYRAVVGALDTLTKVNIQNKKTKAAKELKQMDIESKKELPAGAGSTTNVLIATREDIIKNFIEKGKDVIDADVEDIDDIE